jgi:hypothetical protein
MKTFNYLAAGVVVLSYLVPAARGTVSTFDTEDEGWRITGDAQGSSVLPTHHLTGGNPGGYISATDNVQGGVWYFKAPAAFHGDYSVAYGTELEFDLKQSSLNSQFNSVDVYLRGGGLELTYDTPNNPGTVWTSYRLALTEAGGWRIGGAIPTQAQMLQVLGDVTDLQIRGEFVTGADTGSLDNVRLVGPAIDPDLTGEGCVNLEDFAILAAWWGAGCDVSNDWCGGTDFDLSGAVGLPDFVIFTGYWLMCDAAE